MKKKIFIASLIFLMLSIGLYQINKYIGIIDLSTISVETDDNLSKNKVKIEKGFFTINRSNDESLFRDNGKWTVFNGFQNGILNNDYGENDFLITYDNKYYFQFRHFKFNRRHQHTYIFFLHKKSDTLFLKASIEGPKGFSFERPMNLITDAKNLRCNVPIDSNRHIYNMIELKEPKKK